MNEEKKRLVSVIMPAFNSERTIHNSILSVLRQTYDNLELIIVDDGSNDDTWRIIKDASEKDNRVRPYHKANGGVSSARNFGIEKARGTYVCFIDSDDEYLPDYIITMVSVLEKNQAEVVMCGYIESGLNKKVSYNDKVYRSFDEMRNEFNGLYLSTYLNIPWNKMFVLDKINCLFPEQFSIGEDLLFNIWNIKKMNRIVTIAECLYLFTTQKSNSLTMRFHENAFEASIMVHDELKTIVPDRKIFLLNCLWTDYWRCIYKLCLNEKIKMKKKHEIYKVWESHTCIKWLRKNWKMIRDPKKYIYVLNSFTFIRLILKVKDKISKMGSECNE